MFAYRHAFHAGNHADVIKHAVALYALGYLQQKPGAVQVIDTHAGAGRYQVDARLVRDKAEYNTGLGRLWPMKPEGFPPLMAHYMEAIRESLGVQPGEELRELPGSPLLLADQLREIDLLRAYELHPTDFPLLEQALGDRGRRVKAEKADGFHAMRALLPPVSRRGLVLMDPPYEIKSDYAKALKALREGVERFANGCYIIWLPMLQRFEVQHFLRSAGQLGVPDNLLISFKVRGPQADGRGLMGSHLVVLNPPYGLEAACRQALPWLVKQLGQDTSAAFQIGPLPRSEIGRGPARILGSYAVVGERPGQRAPRAPGQRGQRPDGPGQTRAARGPAGIGGAEGTGQRAPRAPGQRGQRPDGPGQTRAARGPAGMGGAEGTGQRAPRAPGQRGQRPDGPGQTRTARGPAGAGGAASSRPPRPSTKKR